MKSGDMFVLDEINLAEDAVIERLNSVLESGRTYDIWRTTPHLFYIWRISTFVNRLY